MKKGMAILLTVTLVLSFGTTAFASGPAVGVSVDGIFSKLGEFSFRDAGILLIVVLAGFGAGTIVRRFWNKKS